MHFSNSIYFLLFTVHIVYFFVKFSRYADDFPCLLEYSLGELIKVYDSLDTMKDLMAHFTRSGQNDVQDVGNALEKLTENTTKFDKVLPGKINNFCNSKIILYLRNYFETLNF